MHIAPIRARRLMKNKIMRVTILLLGMAGALLFFPVLLPEDALCLAEKWFAPPALSGETDSAHGMHHVDSARHYLIPYGLLWWASLAVIFISIRKFLLKRESK